MKHIFTVIFVLLAEVMAGQSESHDFVTYDTTITLPSGQWNAKVTRPKDNADYRAAVVFMTGASEIGPGNFAGLSVNGPHYWLKNGWDGSVPLPNGIHYPIIISVSPYTSFPSYRSAGDLLKFLAGTYSMRRGAIYLAGLSMGSMTWNGMLTTEEFAGDETYMKLVKAVISLQGNATSFGAPLYMLAGNLVIGTNYSAFGIFAKKYGGKMFGLSGTSDFSGPGVWKMTEPMNQQQPNSAYHMYTTLNGGAHCCWNQMMNPAAKNWKDTAFLTNKAWDGTHASQGTYIKGYNVWQWALLQGDTTMSGGSTNLPPPPTANAGRDTTIAFPLRSINLFGEGTGEEITYSWNLMSIQKLGVNLTSQTNKMTFNTHDSLVYTFRMTVTDKFGQKASDDVKVTTVWYAYDKLVELFIASPGVPPTQHSLIIMNDLTPAVGVKW